MRTGEVEVQRGAGFQVGADLPPVQLGDSPAGIGDGDGDRADEVLVAGSPVDAEALEAGTYLGPADGPIRRQPEAERAVGEAKTEALYGNRVVDAASLQVPEGLRLALQRGVVVVDHLSQQGAVGGIGIDGRAQAPGRRANRRSPGSRAQVCRFASAEEFDGVAEADAFCSHHPVDDAAADMASPHAVPEAFGGSYDERRSVVVVERAATDEVGAGLLQLDAMAGDHLGQVDLLLQPLDHLVCDACHPASLPLRLSRRYYALLRVEIML